MTHEFELVVLDRRMAEFLPEYTSPGAAAVDLRACIDDPITVLPNEVKLIGTGIAIHIKDESIAGMILPRSGLGHKNGVILGNGTGLIDSDYQGELKISVWNRSGQPFTINHNDRIAQYVFVPVLRANFKVVAAFGEESNRGEGGFGHTGVS